jgi:hypothetical protein
LSERLGGERERCRRGEGLLLLRLGDLDLLGDLERRRGERERRSGGERDRFRSRDLLLEGERLRRSLSGVLDLDFDLLTPGLLDLDLDFSARLVT